MWIFDLPDGGGRLLRERSGHSAPPNKLRHYGSTGHNILSAGRLTHRNGSWQQWGPFAICLLGNFASFLSFCDFVQKSILKK